MPLTRSMASTNPASITTTTSTNEVPLPTSIITSCPATVPVTTPSVTDLPVLAPRKRVMSLNAKTLEKQLRPFDGNKAKLGEFLATCEVTLKLVDPAEKNILFELIKLKLTDRAYQATKFREFATFDELKKHLTELFGDKQSRQRLETLFYSARQGQNESVLQFSERVESNLYKLIDCVTPSLDANYRPKHEEQLRIQAKNIFIGGLRDNLSLLLKARNPDTLEESIGLAITEDRELSSRRDMFNHSQRNNGNYKPNHSHNGNHKNISSNNGNYKGNNNQNRPNFGYKSNGNQYNNQNYNQNKGNSNQPSTSGQGRFNPQNGKQNSNYQKTKYDENSFCTFCKIKGHDLSICRSKKRAETIAANSYSLNSQQVSETRQTN